MFSNLVRFCIAVTLFGSLALTQAHAETLGFVFIHGKAGESLENPDKAWEYWSTEMIETTTKGYTVPYTVVAYDSTRHMTKAANVVADQVGQFLDDHPVDKIIINTHSFGGVIIRWMFSNPEVDARFERILSKTKWVNAMACPCAGSEVADLAETLHENFLSSWFIRLIGHDTPSTWNLRTNDMAYYNEHFLYGTKGRPQLPVPFYTVSGNDRANDWWNFHLKDIRIVVLAWLTGFPGDNDGVVTVASSESVGQSWVKTDANHYHNARNDYRPLGEAIAKDIEGAKSS